MLEKLEYELEFITPAFIGGANSDEVSELRPASMVGMLRYWFRVIVGAFVESTEELFKLESELFGNQEKAGRVWVRVLNQGISTERKEYVLNERYERYLFGIKNGILIKKGSKFKLIVFTPKKYKEFTDYLIRFTLTFGNLGYRARKGFGSMDFDRKIEEIDIKFIKNLLRNTFDKDKRFEFTRNKEFPNISNAIFLKKKRIASNELENLGRIYYTFRRNGRENYKTVEYFTFIKDFLKNQGIRRIEIKNHMFGLPIMYTSRSLSCKKKIKGREKTIKAQAQLNWIQQVKNEEKKDNRRPAPFWISIKRKMAYAVLFTSEFLPKDAEIILTAKGEFWEKCKKSNSPLTKTINNVNFDYSIYSIVENFLNRAGFTEKLFDFREVKDAK